MRIGYTLSDRGDEYPHYILTCDFLTTIGISLSELRDLLEALVPYSTQSIHGEDARGPLFKIERTRRAELLSPSCIEGSITRTFDSRDLSDACARLGLVSFGIGGSEYHPVAMYCRLTPCNPEPDSTAYCGKLSFRWAADNAAKLKRLFTLEVLVLTNRSAPSTSCTTTIATQLREVITGLNKALALGITLHADSGVTVTTRAPAMPGTTVSLAGAAASAGVTP